jgi:hypothetical protein
MEKAGNRVVILPHYCDLLGVLHHLIKYAVLQLAATSGSS